MNEPSDGEERSQLQAAALELIAAARAFLDVAEHVVRDPAASAVAISTIAEVGRAVVRTVTGGPTSGSPPS